MDAMTDLERFDLVDDVRRACDQQGIGYEFDGYFTRANLAWIFEKARLQIVSENVPLWREWSLLDRQAWEDYRKWEDEFFRLENGRPLKDPPGLVEARREFEKRQTIERDKFFKKARYGEKPVR
jgi:hypothetical protein